MKRLGCLFLACLFMFCAVSCTMPTHNTDETETAPPISAEQSLQESEVQETTALQAVTTEQTPSFPAGFEELESSFGRRILDDNWSGKLLSFGDDALSLVLSIPSDWTFVKLLGDSWRIYCDGTTVGQVSVSAPIDVLRTLPVGSIENDIMKGECRVVRVLTEDSVDFRRVFSFTYGDGDAERVVYMDIGYVDLDDEGCLKILEETTVITRNASVGTLSHFLEKPKSILILGNSFVRTSKVGLFLEDMIQSGDEGYEVVPVSVSSACVRVFTDVEPTKYLEPVRAGQYSVVFQCGFYHNDDISTFVPMIEACAASGTQLVFFPAYNENRSVLQSLFRKYPSITVVDWKQEVTDMIQAGVDKWDMCQDDAWLHSKPLAGYVGAHMIYRALFETLPPDLTSEAPLSMSEIRKKLGDYPDTGDVASVKEVYK